jgi:hypothetical protein
MTRINDFKVFGYCSFGLGIGIYAQSRYEYIMAIGLILIIIGSLVLSTEEIK